MVVVVTVKIKLTIWKLITELVHDKKLNNQLITFKNRKKRIVQLG